MQSDWRRRLVIAAFGRLLLLEYSTAVRLFTVPQPPSVYAWLRREPPAVVVELPLPRPENLGVIHDGLYMYFSTTHCHRLVNGYSGFYPPSLIRLLEIMRAFPDNASIDALRNLGVDYAIVHAASSLQSNTPPSSLSWKIVSISPVSEDFLRLVESRACIGCSACHGLGRGDLLLCQVVRERQLACPLPGIVQ